MADDRRRAAATAGTGYVLVGTGGVTRGRAVDAAHNALALDRRRIPPARAILQLRRANRIGGNRLLRRYGVGTALATLGAPAAAKGTLDLVRRPDDVHKSFVNGVYKPAHLLTQAERASVRRTRGRGPRGSINARGTSPADNPINEALHELRRAPTRASAHPKIRFTEATPPHLEHQVLDQLRGHKVRRPMQFEVGHSTGASHVAGWTLNRFGSQRTHVQLPENYNQHTLHHELAHAQRKSNYGHAMRTQQDPTKRMREEARADTLAHRAAPDAGIGGYEQGAIINRLASRGHFGARRVLRRAGPALREQLGGKPGADAYRSMREHLGRPMVARRQLPKDVRRAIGNPAGIDTSNPEHVYNAAIYGGVIPAALIAGQEKRRRQRQRQVAKRDQPRTQRAPHHSLVAEGVHGTTEAWQDKAQALHSGAPLSVRAVPVAVGGVAGAGGSLAAHRALDLIARRRPVSPRVRHGLTAVAAVPAVVASLPVSRHWTRRRGYNPQPTGGLTRVTSSKGLYLGQDYHGRHVSPSQQRMRTYAAGAAPVVGPVAASRQAGLYAPPGGRVQAEARETTVPFAAAAGGVGGAYGVAHLADHNRHVARATQQVAETGEKVKAKVLRREVRPAGEGGKMMRRVAHTRVGKPLFASPRRAIGAVVGWQVGRAIAGQGAQQLAMSRNIAAEHRYDREHTLNFPLVKKSAVSVEVLTRPQAEQLAERKRRSAVMSVIAGSSGLTALGLQVASRRRKLIPAAKEQLLRHRDTALTVAAGVGGVNALTNAAIQRREAKAIHKNALASSVWFDKGMWVPSRQQPLPTQMTDEEAHKLVHGTGGYGLTGKLPSHLDRDERKRAYEARYLSAGGRKSNKWRRRAQVSEVVRNVGVAGGTLAGAAWLGAGSPRLKRAAFLTRVGSHAGRRLSEEGVKRRAERTAVGAATLAGGAELAGEYSRHKRGSYASAPGGVAASALRRMQNYDAYSRS